MKPKQIRLIQRELKELQSLLQSNPDFDYARQEDIAQRADALLKQAIAASRANPKDDEVSKLHGMTAMLFREAIAAAYPPAFRQDVAQLKARNTAGLPTALSFLEADPWFFRSGYIKAQLITYLCRIELPQPAAERLEAVVLAAIDRRDRREFRHYCQLARKVDSPSLRDALRARLTHDTPAIKRRARWVLDACERPT